MAQFDIYRMNAGGLVMDIQSELVDTRETRIVVPLLAVDDAPQPIDRVNFPLRFEGSDYVVEMQYLASVPAIGLMRPVGAAPHVRDNVTRALDMLFHGI